MRILLTTLNSKYIHINLAIRLLYQLNKSHKGLAWKEFTIKENQDQVALFCQDYDVIAFSCYIWNITQTLEVCRKIKALNPDIKILLGGPEVSYEWQTVIEKDEVDFIILGEGEIPFSSFLGFYPQHISLIPSLVWKNDGNIQVNAQAEIFDLNNLIDIMPYASDEVEDLKNKVCYVETSRGCPYKCEFCLASLDNKMRYLPLLDLKKVLLFLMENVKVIKFLDRTFNIKRDFTLDIFNFILENHRPFNVFQFEITADILHADIINFIVEKVPKGLFRFEIGIQTINQKANLEVSRKQNFEKTKNIILSLKDKVDMHLDLIVGLPLDYWDDIKFSFESVFLLYPSELQLGFLKFLKGTPVRDKHKLHGFVFDENPPYQIIKSDYLSHEELTDIEILEEALELFWNKKRAKLTLAYVSIRYSIFDFLLNLGKYFTRKSDFHGHGLIESFDILFDFVSMNYPDDQTLQEMVAVDYYIKNKVKPMIKYKSEIDPLLKNELLSKHQLTSNAKRYIVIQNSIDVQLLQNQQLIEERNGHLALIYNGVDYPEIVNL